MTVTVYIWDKDTQGVGHAAVDVNGNYCSFWPGEGGYDGKNAVNKDRVPSANHDYYQDYNGEERAHDRAVTIEGLDEAAMLRKWGEMRSKPYSFTDQNCSTVVGKMLEAGAGMKPTFPVKAYPSEYMTDGGYNTYIAKAAAKALDTYAVARKLHNVWTPALAHDFAAELPGRVQALIAKQQPRRSSGSDSDQSYHSARSHLSNSSQGRSQGHSRR
jgi:hypothetical protein